MLGGNTLQSLNTIATNMVGHLSECNFADWIIDNVANEHMTGNYSLMSDVKSLCTFYSSVRLPNGSHLSVSDKGDVAVSDKLILHSVIYVPNFHFNLLSISKFTKSHNCCHILSTLLHISGPQK